MTWYIIVTLVALVVAYAFILRPILREHPWFDPIYDWLEPVEARLWAKSRTILVARLAWVPTALLLLHDTVGAWALDASPILSRLLGGIPDDIRPQVIAALVGLYGMAVEWLRRVTTEPLAGKE